MSIQAMKAVEVGDGVHSASQCGSNVHDALYPSDDRNGGLPFTRRTNRAGGIEGGMTNGSRLVVRTYMKPIPTIRQGLDSLSFPELKAEKAHYERSDVCAIAAASVVCKAMVSFVLAKTFIDKFGGDSLSDLKAGFADYQKFCRKEHGVAGSHAEKAVGGALHALLPTERLNIDPEPVGNEDSAGEF
jgi:chorismate synthase